MPWRRAGRQRARPSLTCIPMRHIFCRAQTTNYEDPHPMEKLIISADSHVFEPSDLWLKTLGDRFGERVPHAVDRFENHEGSFFYVGRPGEAAKIDELVDAN